MLIGIFSGSFNPVHNGHVALAEWFVHEHVVDAVWLIRSPLNPLKAATAVQMAPDADRLAMLRLAIEGHDALSISTIEDDMPRPSYSYHTLQRLREQYPEHEFHFIIGSDNWQHFSRWYRWQDILREFHLVVYPRPGYPVDAASADLPDAKGIRIVDAPTYDVSSTDIRRLLSGTPSERDEARSLVPPPVMHYIQEHGLYAMHS